MKIATYEDDKSEIGDREHKYQQQLDDDKEEEDTTDNDQQSLPLTMPVDCIPAETNYYLGGLRAHIIEGPGIYYIGIIDALQPYTWKKRLETWFRIHIQRKNGKGISCIDPKSYRTRFMKYMRNVMISEQRYKRKLKLNRKNFTREQVLIYPSSEKVSKNLNDIKRERSRKGSSFSAVGRRHRNRSHSGYNNNSTFNAEDSLPTHSGHPSQFKHLQAVVESGSHQLTDSIKTL